jgi:hypothetical protein
LHPPNHKHQCDPTPFFFTHPLTPHLICSRSKLEALKRAEGERASSFTQLLDKYAADGVKGIEAQGPVIRQRLVHLVSECSEWVQPLREDSN